MRLPTEQEASAAGFSVADYEVEVEIWPENWPAVEIFTLFDTQWRTGFNGPEGLDYSVVCQLLDRKISGENWWQMFDDIRIMERAALLAIRGKELEM